MTATERARFVALGTEIDSIDQQIAENRRDFEAAHAANESERNFRFPGDADTSLTRPRGQRFAELFGEQPTLGDWKSSGEFLTCIGRGLFDSRLKADSNSGGVPSAGGFAVPSELFGEWLDASLETEIVRPRARTFPMRSAELDAPAFDDLDRSSGSIGNLALRFESELSTMTPQVARLRSLKLRAHRAALFLEASNDLASDAPNFEGNISAALTRVLGFGLDNEFLWGSGAGRPLGAFASPAAIEVSRSTAGHVIYDDVLAMFARLTPASVGTAIWLANPATLPDIAALSLVVGTAGAHVPILSSTGGGFSLLGIPLVLSEKMKSLGTTGDFALADFSRYAIGLRSVASLDKSQHVGFARDVETYRLQIRLDGQPTLSSPITPLNGSTLSPFVVLS